jgi:cytochrome c oxidase subunit III
METTLREKEKEPAVPYIPPGNGSGNGGGGWGGGIPHNRSNYSIPIHPAKFGLWLFIAASMMLFAAFTSAYIVRSGAGDWLRFGIPTVMQIGTVALIFSSLTIHIALRSIKAGSISSFKTSIVLTLLLAVVFVSGQVLGWQSLRLSGLYLDTNASSAFFYMITVTHLVHVIGGMAALLFVTTKGLLGRYTQNNRLGVELCATYWHFLGALWVYLALFITFT